ncbi:MAG: hypothetical protein VX246_06675 [Myxococcota bacterium]|nr:hypothetical protein [Myxococcota bacterium]
MYLPSGPKHKKPHLCIDDRSERRFLIAGGPERVNPLTTKIALLLWPLLTVIVASRVRPAIAASSLLLGAILFLPTLAAFDFPLLPPIGREEIASLSLLGVLLLFYPKKFFAARPGLGAESLILVVMLSGIGTAYTNSDALVYGPRILPSVTLKDAFSDAARDFLHYFVPFLTARVVFRSRRDLRDLLLVLAVFGLIYSLPILVELRLSPQLNRWIYGFFPHSFHQHVRDSGYRPMVFMPNGLAVAQFIALCTIAAAALTVARARFLPIEGKLVTAYLASILVLCKGMAATLYAGAGLILVHLTTPRLRATLAVSLAAFATAFPLLRGYGLFPTDSVVAAISRINAERAHSLNYRFINEDLLLEKAQERILFGWGGFSRGRVFDPRHGGSITVTDGFWIIQLGQSGILGTLPIFGMIGLPVLLVYRRLPHVRSAQHRSMLASLAVIVGLTSIDLLPNGMFTYLPIILAGALLGTTEGLQRTHRNRPAPHGRAQPEEDSPKTAKEDATGPQPTSVSVPGTTSDRSASLAAARRKKR